MKIAIKLFLLFVIMQSAYAFGQTPIPRAVPTSLPKSLRTDRVDEIVKKFSENEKLFHDALADYSFDRQASISELGMAGQIAGTFRLDSSIVFTSDGMRSEKISYAPQSTLQNLQITKADLENLGGIDPFAIEPKALSNYEFTYVGDEKIDELNLYVFDVRPKVVPDFKKGIRYFLGRVWVDRDDLMIVKTKGKAVPEGEERFPVIETWRENIDGKFWFPSYSSADDTLEFKNGAVIRIRVRVKYLNYRVGRTDVRILDDEETPTPTPEPSPTPAKKP